MKTKFCLLTLLLTLTFYFTGFAQDAVEPPLTAEEQAKQEQLLKDFIASLKFQKGKIIVKDGLATMNLPDSMLYLNPEDTQRVVVDLWANPPSEIKYLGMIVPSVESLTDKDGWSVLIDYSEDGYIKDDEADKINYDDMLKSMKEGTVEDSKERVKQGYPTIELLGWAEPPHYDKDSKKLYWAKEFKFGDSSTIELNYNVRILGRRGVLVLNALASKDKLQMIHTEMQNVLNIVEFNEGHRYTDFIPGKDKVAEYGIGALIAGGLLAKTGFFKALLGILLAAKKFIIVGVIAVGVFLRKLLMKPKISKESSVEPNPKNP